jgi:hypothetical protein
MQRFLHDQPGAQKSYDIITQTCTLFEVVIRHNRPAILPVAVKGTRLSVVIAVYGRSADLCVMRRSIQMVDCCVD